MRFVQPTNADIQSIKLLLNASHFSHDLSVRYRMLALTLGRNECERYDWHFVGAIDHEMARLNGGSSTTA